MPKPITAYVHCLHCTTGRNGDKSCGSGAEVTTLAGGGCFNGTPLPGKGPKAPVAGVTGKGDGADA